MYSEYNILGHNWDIGDEEELDLDGIGYTSQSAPVIKEAIAENNGSTNKNWGEYLEYVGYGLQLGQGVGKAYGAYTGAKAKAATLNAQASVTMDSARVSELAAQYAFAQGTAEIGKLTRQAGQKKAAQRSAMAASGAAVGVGSSAQVLASTDINKEVDKITAHSNAVANAWGYRRQALIQEGQAEAMQTMAKAYSKSAWSSALGTLLSSVGQVSMSYYRNNYSTK